MTGKLVPCKRRKGHGSAALSTFDRAEGLQLIQGGSGLPGQLHGTLVPNRFSLAHLRIGRHFPAYRFVSRNVRFTARCAIIWANNICITHLTIHQATLLSQKIVISIKTRARGVSPTATVLAIYIKLYLIYYCFLLIIFLSFIIIINHELQASIYLIFITEAHYYILVTKKNQTA